MSEIRAQVQCYCAVDTEGHLWAPESGCTRSPVPEPTALPLRDFTAAEQDKLEAIEAAPAEPESVRERLMLAIEEAWGYLPDLERASECSPILADAALAVLRGPSSDAEQAVERVLALADELEHLPGLYERQYVAARIRRAVAGD